MAKNLGYFNIISAHTCIGALDKILDPVSRPLPISTAIYTAMAQSFFAHQSDTTTCAHKNP